MSVFNRYIVNNHNNEFLWVWLWSIIILLFEGENLAEKRVYNKNWKLLALQVGASDPFSFDPLGRPCITAGSDHYIHTCRPSVLTFTHTFQFRPKKTNPHCRLNCGLATWIIDYSCYIFWVLQERILFLACRPHFLSSSRRDERSC